MKSETAPDFSHLPIIDNHCHLFNLEYAPHRLQRILNMSLNELPDDQLRQTMVFRAMIRELGQLLEQGGAGDEAVLAERESRMQADYKGWVHDLFNDGALNTLLIDLGYKPAAVSLDDFEQLIPGRVKYIFRIESVLDELWPQLHSGKIRFEEAEDGFLRKLNDAFDDSSMVGIKSIIGYRTGLKVQPLDRAAMTKSKPDEKGFRDYFLQLALEKATHQGWPVQIHAAFGESNINLLDNNPALLKALLEDMRFKETRIVLVHGGYPFCFEAGYLASVYPNVYVDISEMIPFATLGSLRGLRDIFDFCPFNKLLYGSDGFVLPEIHWLGAKMAKRSLSSLFAEFIEEGLFDRDLAMRTARMIFFDNAEKLYGL